MRGVRGEMATVVENGDLRLEPGRGSLRFI